MTNYTINNHVKYMQLALNEAKKAWDKNEVPVGAVIIETLSGKVVSRSYNQSVMHCNPTFHAEIVAITKLAKKIQNYRLNGYSLYVTLEPCLMCAGALLHSRIDNVYFGASDTKGGAIVNNAKVYDSKFKYNHKICWEGGILEEDSKTILQNFFKNKR